MEEWEWFQSRARSGKTVAALELAAIDLIKIIQSKMGYKALGIDSELSALSEPPIVEIDKAYRFPTAQVSELSSKSEQTDSTKTFFPTTQESETTETSATKISKSSTVIEPVKLLFPTTQASESATKSGLPGVSQHEVVSSAYAGHLATAAPRKASSKAASKCSSKASSAAKLRLRLEEAEVKIQAQYSAELDMRAQRVLARNAVKAKEQQQREEEEHRRKMERAKEQQQREEEEHRRRIERAKEQQQREEEENRLRLEDEKDAREAQIRMKMASIHAKKLVIDEYDDELEEKQSQKAVSLGIAEVDPLDKAAAFVGNLFKLEFEVHKQAELKKVAEKSSEVLKSVTQISTQNVSDRKGESASVKGGIKTHEVKGEISNTLKLEHFPLPTYTTPVADLHSAWASQAAPAPVISGFPHKIEPLAYNRLAESNDIKTNKPQISAPLLRNESSNSYPFNSAFPHLLDQSVMNTRAQSQAQENIQCSTAAEGSGADRVIEAVCGQMALSRLPLSEPDTFDGTDFLQFPMWKMGFEALINRGAMTPADKLNLLARCIKGEARVAVQGFMYLPPEKAFAKAYGLLIDRYGDNFHMAGAFKERLKSWPKIGGTDFVGLRNFIDYLRQCENAKESFQGLRTLDDESENADLVKKLPVWLSRQWTRRVSTLRRATGEYPSFSDFIEFLAEEDCIAHDPLARTLQKSEVAKTKRSGTSFASNSRIGSSNPGEGIGRSFGICSFCDERHSIQVCDKFGAQTYDYRQQFIRDHQLCFECLIRGHVVRNCRNRKVCKKCQGGHPTSLHRTKNNSENSPPAVPITACASSRDSNSTPQKSSMVIPVRISHIDNPDKGKIIYAMLDSQSDSSFITDNTARALGLQGTETRLSLSTMTSSDRVVKCRRYRGLEVQGINSSIKIRLPQVYSRKSIPINYKYIPCSEMVEDWPHLHPLRGKLAPRLNHEVGILIGFDCPEALFPQDVISAPRSSGGPFGWKSDLGWGIVGVIGKPENDEIDQIS